MRTPPRLANACLRLVAGDEDFEAIAGDLEEIYRTDVVPRHHIVVAHAWYWRQVTSIVLSRWLSALVSDRQDELAATHPRTAMTSIRQDLSYALRALSKQPVFTTVAVVTLALGIGANVAIFSLVNAILFKPLPFSDPYRLMRVHLLNPDRDNPGVFGRIVWSYPKYDLFRSHQRAFESIALFNPEELNVTGSGTPERVRGESVEATYLATLGVAPLLGRGFLQDETRAPGSAPIVMLGHGFWQRRFGADPSVLGRTVGLNGVAHTIVGVLPPAFRGLSGQAEIWVPVMTRSAADLGEIWNHTYSVVARRKAEVTPEQAEAASRLLGAEVSAHFETLRAKPGVSRPAWSATAVPLDDERVDPIIRRSMLLMLAAVASVLLIVCVNLANLILARALSRQQEVGIRLALGASRARIVRLLMTENLLLALWGGLAGLAVAVGAVASGAALLPDLGLVLPEETGGLTRVGLNGLGPDWRTMAFAVALVTATAVMFGLGPAWRASRGDLTTAIRASSAATASSGRRHLPVRHVLIVGEIALALVLLSAGGLMLKSVARLHATELGFNASSLVSARLTMPPEQYDNARATRLLTQLLERLAAHSQVETVAYSSCAPLSGMCNGTTARFPGQPQPLNTPSTPVGVHWASPTYFSTLGIRVIKGRVFTPQDTTDRPKVVVINEKAARTFWPGIDPIGQRISVGQGGFGDGAEVIGVVADVRYEAVESAVSPDVYLPLLQSSRRGGIIFVKPLRPSSGQAGATLEPLVSTIRAEVHALDPDLPLVDVKMMDERFGDATWRTRTSAWLLGAFSTLALVLAAVGIYGVVSQTVAQRSRELGVRVALGASRGDIMRLVLGRVFIFAIAGVALGTALAIPALRLLTALLYEVSPGDPMVLTSLALGLLMVAVLASYLPARRASRIDPLAALRAQ
jgi:putative ABC transport system permease protein